MGGKKSMYGNVLYGAGFYGYGSDEEQDHMIGYDMMQYLPSIYHLTGHNTKKLMSNVVGAEFAIALKYPEEAEMQRAVSQATWGLSRWEEELGLPTELDKDIADRRNAVLSQLGGKGITTNQVIKELAQTLINTKVKINENFEGFITDIIIVGMKGTPANLDLFAQTIEEILPAHLDYNILTTRLTWDELESYGHSWDEWDAKGLTWDEFELYEG